MSSADFSQSPAEGQAEGGGRVVFYESCVSLVFWTLRWQGRPQRLRPGEWGLLRGLPYALVALLFGWWGLPWGLIYTPLVLWTNLSGGRTIGPGELGPERRSA